MANKFVSYERLVQYDELIKRFIESLINDANGDISGLQEQLNALRGEGEGTVQEQIQAAFDEFVNTDGGAGALDSYKEVLAYVQNHGTEFNGVVNDIVALQGQVGSEATDEAEATGLFKDVEDLKAALADSDEALRNQEISAISDESKDIVISLSGTVTQPVLDVLYTLCTEEDVDRLFIPVLQATTYDELVDAIANAVAGQTIKVNSPIEQQVTIPVGKEIVLDLNGQTISSEGSAIINNGILTISDNSLGRSNGVIRSSKNCGIAAGNNSVTTILSGVIEGQEGAVITGKASGATVNIEGGDFKAFDNAVIAGNGTNRTGEPNVINISGGRFESNIQSNGYIACGVYAPWKDTVNITGGEFIVNNGCGVLARAGQVNITGGTFTTTGTGTGWVGDNKNQVPCAAIVFDSNANYPGMDADSKITVSGGTFSSEVAPVQALGSGDRIVVNDGNFSQSN